MWQKHENVMLHCIIGEKKLFNLKIKYVFSSDFFFNNSNFKISKYFIKKIIKIDFYENFVYITNEINVL